MQKHLSDVNTLATIIALMAGTWGAILNYSQRDTKEHSILKKISMFFMDMIINVGITMLVYLGLIGYGIGDLVAVAISGFVGHQGTRSFYLIELIIAEKLGAKKTYEILQAEREERKGVKNDTNTK